MTKQTKIISVALLVVFSVMYMLYSIFYFSSIFHNYYKLSNLDIIYAVINQILMLVVCVVCVWCILKHKNENTLPSLPKRQEKITFWVVIFVAIFLRCFMFTLIPQSMSPDEMTMLYDSYSLANFGIDRSGRAYPVYLEAWGSGQSALLAYLTIPFVKIFGVNVFQLELYR